jgi:hypothetical protein
MKNDISSYFDGNSLPRCIRSWHVQACADGEQVNRVEFRMNVRNEKDGEWELRPNYGSFPPERVHGEACEDRKGERVSRGPIVTMIEASGVLVTAARFTANGDNYIICGKPFPAIVSEMSNQNSQSG